MAKSVQKGIAAVPGIRVGHATDPGGLTGCTVVLCEKGAVGGVDQRGVPSALHPFRCRLALCAVYGPQGCGRQFSRRLCSGSRG